MEPINLNPEEKKRIREMLIKKVRNVTLMIIGIIMVVLVVLIVTGDGGKLFKGDIFVQGEDAPPEFAIPLFSPTVVSVTPANGAVNIPTAAGFALVTFDEDNLVLNLTKDITIKKQGTEVDKSPAIPAFTFTPATKTLSIPYTELEANSLYTVFVPKETVKNNGEPLDEDLTWSFTTAQGAAPPPPQPAACVENQLQANDTQICKGAVWVTCTAQLVGLKSTDGTKECKDLKWQAVAAPPGPAPGPAPPAPVTCTENTTKNSDKQLCKSNEWITCTEAKEGEKSTDKKKECKSLKWTAVAAPAPSGGDIKIESHDIFPKGFNPLLNETKISYKISADAKVEIKILNQSGVTVVTLLDDKAIDKGEYYVWWNGTDKADSEGTVVAPGEYVYKIFAKDPESGETKDIKTGKVTALYQTVGGDFEDPAGNGGGVDDNTSNGSGANNNANSGAAGNSGSGTTGSSGNSGVQSTDMAATVALQNSKDGVTAETGMPIYIYVLLIPIVYFIVNTSLIKKND